MAAARTLVYSFTSGYSFGARGDVMYEQLRHKAGSRSGLKSTVSHPNARAFFLQNDSQSQPCLGHTSLQTCTQYLAVISLC